jgi:RecB family exonuclease
VDPRAAAVSDVYGQRGVDKLPTRIGDVECPARFSPSTFEDLELCPLMVINVVSEGDRLPPHPLALLGTLLHDVLLRVARDPERPAHQVFRERLAALEARLASDAATRALVPLERAVGRTRWRARLARLVMWSSREPDVSRHGEGANAVRRNTAHREPQRSPQDIRIGSEVPLESDNLRLVGRADSISIDSDGTYHIVDYKSGAVTDAKGTILQSHAVQLGLYALIVESEKPSARVRLWLDGAQRIEVPWDARSRTRVSDALAAVSERLPAGAVVSSDSVASPGAHCARCRIRHRCPAYHRTAPTWWLKKETRGYVAPFDVWGTISEVTAEQNRISEIVLRDDRERRVRISGLSERWSVGDVSPGDRIYCFDLESSETMPFHGVYEHPRNFHVQRPNLTAKDALRFRAFRPV